MGWIILILIVVGIIWMVKRRKNAANQQQIPQNRPTVNLERPDALQRQNQAQDQAQSTDNGDGTKQCPYCAETIKSQAIVCRFCGRDLTGMNTQNGRYDDDYRRSRGGSMVRDAMLMGGTALATHAIINSMSEDERNQSERSTLAEDGNTDAPASYESSNDTDSGNGLSSLSSIGSSDSSSDDSNSAAWITDENDSGDSSWSSSSNDDDGGWSFGSDDSDSGSSWDFGSDDSDFGGGWSDD